MAYCAVADVRLALAQADPSGNPLSAGTNSAADLPDAQLTDAINEASGRVDAYIAAAYSVPVAPPDPARPTIGPEPVRSLARDIAAYLATLTYRRSKDLGSDDPVRLRYQVAVDLLSDVRDGKIVLPIPRPPDDADTSGGVTVANQYEGDMFPYGQLVYPPQTRDITNPYADRPWYYPEAPGVWR